MTIDDPNPKQPEPDDERVAVDRGSDHPVDRADALDRHSGALRAGGGLRAAVKDLRDDWT